MTYFPIWRYCSSLGCSPVSGEQKVGGEQGCKSGDKVPKFDGCSCSTFFLGPWLKCSRGRGCCRFIEPTSSNWVGKNWTSGPPNVTKKMNGSIAYISQTWIQQSFLCINVKYKYLQLLHIQKWAPVILKKYRLLPAKNQMFFLLFERKFSWGSWDFSTAILKAVLSSKTNYNNSQMFIAYTWNWTTVWPLTVYHKSHFHYQWSPAQITINALKCVMF